MTGAAEVRDVFVVGAGLHPYQPPSATPYVTLGLTAIRAALADADIDWQAVESAYVGTALIGAATGRPMLRHLGATGLSVVQVENASATGSSAFRQAYVEVAGGLTDVVLAVGVDKPAMRPDGFQAAGAVDLAGGLVSPAAQFALLGDRYLGESGVSPAALAAVAVKNHRNGLLNPNAQRREKLTERDVLESSPIAGALTKYQCCPVGEGAAAVIVASAEAIERLGIDPARAVRIAASVSRSEELYPDGVNADEELTRVTTAEALQQAGITAADLDVVELHDAFSVEELIYLEAMGLSARHEAGRDILAGDYDIGGRCAVSPSGGLESMGHPVGPTGIGQIAEITTQLRGEAGERQQPAARVGLAHMLGFGGVCIEHVLVKD